MSFWGNHRAEQGDRNNDALWSSHRYWEEDLRSPLWGIKKLLILHPKESCNSQSHHLLPARDTWQAKSPPGPDHCFVPTAQDFRSLIDDDVLRL
jgi:hypothetical protein